MVHQLAAYVCGLTEGGPVRHEAANAANAPGIRDADGIVTVVDADPFESETARCTPREFADRFGFKIPEQAGSTNVARVAKNLSDDRLRGDELWPWLALGLLGVLLLENFLANRTAA